MKKLLGILIALILVSGIFAGGYFYFQKYKKALPIEEVLPEGVLFYTKMSNVQSNVKKLESNALWQSIMNLDYILLENEGMISEQQSTFIEVLKNNFSNSINTPLFQKIFGQEIALAVYPFTIDFTRLANITAGLSPDVIEEIFSTAILVTRVAPEVQFAEFMIQMWEGKSKSEVSFEKKEYKNRIIHVVTVPDISINVGFTRMEDLLVVGIGVKSIQRVIDGIESKKDFLETDPSYKIAQKKFFAKADTRGYVDVEKVTGLIKKEAARFIDIMQKKRNVQKSEVSTVKTQMKEFFKKVEGLTLFGFSSHWGEVTRQKYALFFDKNQIDEDIALLYTCPSEENATIRFIPESIVGYQWSNCFNLNYYWSQIKKEINKPTGSEEDISPMVRIKATERALGVSIEMDILPIFGDEIGGYISGMQFVAVPMVGEFPIPEIVLFLEADDLNKAEKVLKKVTTNPFVVLQEEDYKDVSIHYAALPLGASVEPAYCFIDKYLLIGLNRNVLKRSIDVYHDAAASIEKDKDFKEFFLSKEKKARSMQFVKMDALMQNTREVIDWSMQWLLQQDKSKSAFKSGAEHRLVDIENNIAEGQGALENFMEQVTVLDDEILKLESVGENIEVKQEELRQLKEREILQKKELEDLQMQKKEQTEMLQGYQDNTQGARQRQIFFDEILYPVLDGLESIKILGGKTTVDSGVMESESFLK
ncbi:hypothetical protein MNBD_UNCLBAC01-2000 [hydrothermal vent metagenome]|uniref:DUF3352 domain-containing protein n=1 Tax=hydrothermal vent metagenome TaxID=652676 RepID=A0A3B1DGL6_9ZZZZ